MKTKYVLIIIAFMGILLITCNKDSEEPAQTNKEVTPWKAGMNLTYSFIAGGDTVIKMRDEVLDYGYADFPVLMLVHSETLIFTEEWGDIFRPLRKEKLDSVLSIWAEEFHMEYLSVQGKAFVARHFLDYIVSNDLDVGIFVDLILAGHRNNLAPLMEMIAVIEEMGLDPNDYLYRMEKESIPVSTVLDELESTRQGEIFAFLFCWNFWKASSNSIKIFIDNDTVRNAPDSIISFVCGQDTDPSHYTCNDSIISRDYELKYDAGLWEAKCTYHIETHYNAYTSACTGQFIYACSTIPTYCHVKGPGFVVDGTVTYSTGVNIGTPPNMVPSLNGQVKVKYGDCCCFRKWSVQNFKINGNDGYHEVSWDPGK